MRRHYTILAIVLVAIGATEAFQLPGSSFIGSTRLNKISNNPTTNKIQHNSSSQLQCSALPSLVTKSLSKVSSPSVRNTILLGSAAIYIYKNFRPANFPASKTSDSSFSEPLPNGSLGCPFFGSEYPNDVVCYIPCRFFISHY